MPPHSVNPRLSTEPLTKISKRGARAWTGSQFLEGVAGKEDGDIFRGEVCSFQGGYTKTNIKGGLPKQEGFGQFAD